MQDAVFEPKGGTLGESAFRSGDAPSVLVLVGAGPGLPGRFLYCMQEHSDLWRSVAREMRGGIFHLDMAAPCGSRRPMR